MFYSRVHSRKLDIQQIAQRETSVRNSHHNINIPIHSFPLSILFGAVFILTGSHA